MMSFLDVLLWIGVVYFAVFVFVLVGFSIITDGFRNTSGKFSDRVFRGAFAISFFWFPSLIIILVLWFLVDFVEP